MSPWCFISFLIVSSDVFKKSATALIKLFSAILNCVPMCGGCSCPSESDAIISASCGDAFLNRSASKRVISKRAAIGSISLKLCATSINFMGFLQDK